MKSVIARATMFVMGIFAYLILSIAMYQNAWADDDVNVHTVEFARKLLLDDEMEWGLYYATTAAINAVVNAEAMGFAFGWGDFDAYSAAYDRLYECAFEGKTAQDITLDILAKTDKSSHWGTGVALYVYRECEDVLKVMNSRGDEDTTS